MNAIIVTTDAALRKSIAQYCERTQPAIVIVHAFPGMNPAIGSVTITHPDLVFFDARGDESEILLQMDNTVTRYPQATLILLSSLQSTTLLVEAMRRGIREVIDLPLSAEKLSGMIDRIGAIRRKMSQNYRKIFSFISCKGGSGTTFIADNLAYAMAAVAHKKVLLIDLNLQFGDAGLLLSDVQPAMTLRDLCHQIHRLDADLLASSLIPVLPNFGILSASHDPDPHDSIQPEQIDAILCLARHEYDVVFVDLGRQINSIAIRAIEQSDLIFPVFQQSLPYLRNGRRLLDFLDNSGYPEEKIRLVINRYDASAISLSDIEQSLGQRIAHLVPNNFDRVSEAIGQGESVLKLARNTNISKSLVEMVSVLTDAPVYDRTSIIRRLFVRTRTS